MAYNLKEVMNKPDRLTPGHRLCAGCGAAITVRTVLRALKEEDKAVIGNATGCLEVSSYLYPYTAYEDSYIHNAFACAGATLAGVETAYNALKKRGRIDEDTTYKFITFLIRHGPADMVITFSVRVCLRFKIEGVGSVLKIIMIEITTIRIECNHIIPIPTSLECNRSCKIYTICPITIQCPAIEVITISLRAFNIISNKICASRLI